MPIPLLIALLIAFGMDLPGPEFPGLPSLSGCWRRPAESSWSRSWPSGWEAGSRRGSRILAMRRAGCSGGTLRARGSLTVAGLGIYAWILHHVGWSRLVLSTWGLQGLVLVDDLAVLLPFLAHPVPHLERPLLRRARPARPSGYPRLPVYLASRRGSRSGWSCRSC